MSSSSLLISTTTSKRCGSPEFGTNAGAAQRFFSQGKRIPKDVKRHCGMCKQHGVFVETRGHTCEYKNCQCEQCELVRKRREIMSTQIRLRREQDKKFQRTSDANEADIVPWSGEIGDDKIPENVNMCYFCQKCKNHGILMWKKDHKKKCQFIDCKCEQCDLIDSRRALDRFIKKRKMSNGKEESQKSPKKEDGSTCSSEESFSSSSDSSLSSFCSGSTSNNSIPFIKTEMLTFNNANNSLLSTATASPASSPFQTPSPLLPAVSTTNTGSMPLTFLSVPQILTPIVSTTSSAAGCSTSFFPLMTPSLAYATANLFTNPFLMSTMGNMSPLNMQILLSNLQSLNEMTAAVSLANTD